MWISRADLGGNGVIVYEGEVFWVVRGGFCGRRVVF